ncbi:hypothetical protein [Mycetocola zhadangensis]|uniref:hypothetical protein n=1 Tax=Mycetocola zhadangensis TaxID=1164595 RepID=UPI003A4D2C38
MSKPQQRSVPLGPYSAGEFERLVSTCRAVIDSYNGLRLRPLPDLNVTLAFRILIGFEIGLPPECIDALRVEDLRWQGDRDLRVEFTKNRGSGRNALTFRDTGPWSGPALLTRWVSVFEMLRPDPKSGPLWPWPSDPDPARFEPFSSNRWAVARREFMKTQQVRDDSQSLLVLDMRRLRKTWFARKSKYWHGAVTIDPTHSALVEGDRYLSGSAEPDEVDLTVESAQEDLLRRATAVALVVSDDGDLADGVDDALLVSQRTEGTWDMFAALCRDPFTSPFNQSGTFCTAVVWACLVCPLAVITPAKLPALLRLQDYLRDQSASVTQAEWVRVYGPAWVQLVSRILPQFGDAIIAEARRIVDDDLDLPVPPSPLETR